MDFGGSDLAKAGRRSIKSERGACCGGLSCERGCESECTQALEQVRAELELAWSTRDRRTSGLVPESAAQEDGSRRAQQVTCRIA